MSDKLTLTCEDYSNSAKIKFTRTGDGSLTVKITPTEGPAVAIDLSSESESNIINFFDMEINE